MKRHLTLQFCWITLLIFSCNYFSSAQSLSKIKGITFRGPELAPIHPFMLDNIAQSHANWVAFVPASVIDRQTLNILPETRKYRWYESQIANIESITITKQLGYKVLLKPHLRLPPQTPNQATKTQSSWRGTFAPKDQADWQIWEQEYEQWMIDWANIADELGVEMLCVGTELKVSVVKRTRFWRQLISKIRSVYSGQLIYSANWDEYKQVKFWEELDYIGVNAYFPINDARVPTTAVAIKSWKRYKKPLKRISKKLDMPIIFTEFGYRNIQFAAKTPWQHEKVAATLNNEAQVNLYQAFFETFAPEKWVAGYFLWQWLGIEPYAPNTLFTPQGKPALEVLQQWYRE